MLKMENTVMLTNKDRCWAVRVEAMRDGSPAALTTGRHTEMGHDKRRTPDKGYKHVRWRWHGMYFSHNFSTQLIS